MVIAVVAAVIATLPAGLHRGLWVSLPSFRPVTTRTTFEFMSDVDENDEVTVWSAHPTQQTAYLIDGREVSVSELATFLQGGAWPTDVTASTAGVFTRVEVLTPEATIEPWAEPLAAQRG